MHSTVQLLAATDIIGWAGSELKLIVKVLLIAGTAIGIYHVLRSYFRSPSLTSIVISLLVAGLVLWGINSLNVLRDRVGNELNKGAGPALVRIDAPRPPAGPIADGGRA
ncbi:hypothetical protein BIV57_13570 [Mangrovactinospora gilvigrisea]|uniref:Uncharacterized protein n=1 Tax=Mangrovactinospora gilvigrisea TaxID=1428644 RepID=A0A1J7C652_9ACTN|nr:hypothetical protein [Mangrovactinospora gilvigrisea]OIV37012.1 hypothetical protein BIV57_13570 [Mangrovactinospora gilvigrisea]